MARPVRKTNDFTSLPVGVHRTVAMTTPASRTATATATKTHADSTATVYIAARRAVSARAGPVVSHCTKATATIVKKTAIGRAPPEDQREDQRGHHPKVRRAACELNSRPVHSTKSTVASTIST